MVNQASGTRTWAPAAGTQIDCGETLYKVDQKPVILICGSTPAYRNLAVGNDGKDVTPAGQARLLMERRRPNRPQARAIFTLGGMLPIAWDVQLHQRAGLCGRCQRGGQRPESWYGPRAHGPRAGAAVAGTRSYF